MRSFTECGGKRPRIIEKITEKWWQVSVISLVVCIIYIGMITSPQYNEKCHISENALLPALADENFNYAKHINAHIQNLYGRIDRKAYIETQLRQNGIQTQRQFFNISSDFMKHYGTNIIGIIHANRSPSVEAILVVTNADGNPAETVATLLALALYVREQIYWARDIIFLFADGPTYGIAAYLSAYHDHTIPHMTFDRVNHISGSIVGAFAVKTSGTFFDTMDMQYNLLNGNLPNLDLINLMVQLSDKFGLKPTIYNHGYQKTWTDYLRTAKDAVFTQAFFNNEGIHSIFGLFGIQGITIRFFNTGNGHGSLNDLACICEGALRSLNNILEKFHQSYFLYILPDSRHFISVAYYMPINGLVLVPLILRSLRDWFSIVEFRLCNSYAWIHGMIFISYFIIKGVSVSSLHIYHNVVLLILFTPYYLIFPLENIHIESTRFAISTETCIILSCLSLLNFSLAFLISIIVVLLILLFTCKAASRWIFIGRAAFGFIFHPLLLLSLLILYSVKGFTISEILSWTANLAQINSLFGTYLYPLLFIFLPIVWNISLQLSSASI